MGITLLNNTRLLSQPPQRSEQKVCRQMEGCVFIFIMFKSKLSYQKYNLNWLLLLNKSQRDNNYLHLSRCFEAVVVPSLFC